MNSLSKRINRGIMFLVKEVKAIDVVFPNGISFSNRNFASTDVEWIENANTKNLVLLNNAFSGVTNLSKLDLSKWDVSQVTNLTYMFSNSKITDINISNWNAERVSSTSSMFSNCTSLVNLNMSGFSTSNTLQNMSGMFSSCKKMQNVNLENFNTTNVTSMENVFYDCQEITNLDLSSFNTSNVTSMSQMFYSCTNLTHINFGNNFTLEKCTAWLALSQMFLNVNNLDDQTLNDILKILLTATSYPSSSKQLSVLMSSATAQKCTTLSNWAACEAAGWTT